MAAIEFKKPISSQIKLLEGLEAENRFFSKQAKLSRRNCKELKRIIEDPQQPENVRVTAALLYTHEHTFQEIYASRRLTQITLLHFFQELTPYWR